MRIRCGVSWDGRLRVGNASSVTGRVFGGNSPRHAWSVIRNTFVLCSWTQAQAQHGILEDVAVWFSGCLVW